MNALDMAFIRSRGITVLETPEGENHVTPKSLLYMPGFEPGLTDMIFEMAWPAILMAADIPFILTNKEHNSAKFAAEIDDKYRRIYQPFRDICEEQEVHLDRPERKEIVYWRVADAKTSA